MGRARARPSQDAWAGGRAATDRQIDIYDSSKRVMSGAAIALGMFHAAVRPFALLQRGVGGGVAPNFDFWIGGAPTASLLSKRRKGAGAMRAYTKDRESERANQTVETDDQRGAMGMGKGTVPLGRRLRTPIKTVGM